MDEAEWYALLDRAHRILSELYQPAGVLIVWGARHKWLHDRRPCDLTRENDADEMHRWVDMLDALADGAVV